jgi:hypothetical protein
MEAHYERQIGKVDVLSEGRDYECCITDRRLLIIHVVRPHWYGDAAMFGAVGALIGMAIENKKEKEMIEEKELTRNMTLDELIHKDKKNLSIEYGEIRSIELNKSWPKYMIKIKWKKYNKFYIIDTKENYIKLVDMLSTIESLRTKLSIKHRA